MCGMAESGIESISWSDAELRGLAWDADGRDLVLRIHAADVGSTAFHSRTITCRWAEALEIRLATKAQEGGYPSSFAGAVTRLPDGRYALSVDFASTGELRLVCSEIAVRRGGG
jgi:hypothetical protein